MSGGFGWSLSDVRMLAQYVSRIHHALKDEGGSASEYQQATTTLLSLRTILEQISCGLQDEDPSFRNAVQAQLDGPIGSIAEFNSKLQEKYGTKLGIDAPAGRRHGTWRKTKWAFTAAKDLKEFWITLSRQLASVGLLILSETRSDVAAMESKVTESQKASQHVERQLPIMLKSIDRIDRKVAANQKTFHAIEKQQLVVLKDMADIDTKVAAFQKPLSTIEKQLPLTLSAIRNSHESLKTPIGEIRDFCFIHRNLLRSLQSEHRGFSESVAVQLSALQDWGGQRDDIITDLAGKMSSLTVQVQDTSSTVLDMTKQGDVKSDAAMASIRDLHALMRELTNREEHCQHVSQYAEIQNRIDDIREAVEDWVMVPTNVANDNDHILLKSRNNMTRTLIRVMDNAGAKMENRFEYRFSH